VTRSVLAIDQGTSGTTCLVLDEQGAVTGRSYSEFRQHYPKPGWVEHDAEEIWATTLRVAREAVERSGVEPTAIGITNQRETVVVWDRATGKPVHRAIVWQDRRTAPHCRTLREAGHEALIRQKTGLVIDPYFSATKLSWLLEHVDGLRERAEAGDVLAGTIDSWLIWKLTGGRAHVTDMTNAARTLLYNIGTLAWDRELLELFDVPRVMLPEVRPSSAFFGDAEQALFGRAVPVAGVAGDQQAALFGQGCVRRGLAKNTYGTGAFLLLHTGDAPVTSRSGLLTTVACGPTGEPEYALEGSIFIAGAAVQWLRDGFGIIESAAETESHARELESNDGVYFVPAFVGLGAPHWEPEARGTIVGLTRGTTRNHLVRAAIEAMAYATRDLLHAMESDSGVATRELRVDGGATTNDWLMQFQSDILGLPVVRPAMVETTAAGAAGLAGIHVGIWKDADAFLEVREESRRFEPAMAQAERDALYEGWQRAVGAALGWARQAR
jgi:glycerol kinase